MSETSPAPAAPIERPAVAMAPSNRGPLLFGIGLALAGGALFAALEARRGAVTAPATRPAADTSAGVISAPPELEIPQDFGAAQALQDTSQPSWALPTTSPATPRFIPGSRAPATTRLLQPPRTPSYSGTGSLPTYSPPEFQSAPAVVYRAPASSGAPSANAPSSDTRSKDRVEASMFVNPATTVPKGAILQAVLETALDSTRAGPARAIISRDVRSFDGTRVLIQRGSRLYGEYKADLSSGQNRALIQWQRLMRPDGAVIELDSPSADPLGRAGVKGKVNTHFFERFGGAILQSTLDLGVALATRNVTNGTIVVGLPGSMPQITATQPDQVKPTLKVPQGAAVSVFVARDLDFTKVER